ncbi:MAG: ATP-dependent DNA helicase [Marmoricola sp.]
MPTAPTSVPDAADVDVDGLLDQAVSTFGGTRRDGQHAMALAVADAMEKGRHLLVQAGTGTGKSLGYLVPALAHAAQGESRVVVATATLALQHQLVERDLPALATAIRGSFDKPPRFAVVKGRANYGCLHRVREGVPDDQGVLVEVAETGSIGKEVIALREWLEDEAQNGGTGEKDNAPRHTDRAWRQVSVSRRECLGAAKCAFGDVCFAEQAKERANDAAVVVTNHSLLAIDAIEGIPVLPEYDVVVIDEAHDLVNRVTQAATDELSPGDVSRAARRTQRHVDGPQADDLAEAGEELDAALFEVELGRFEELPARLADALAAVRDSARSLVSALPNPGSSDDAALTQAKATVQDIFDVAGRMAAASERDVLWASERDGLRGSRYLSVAPLDVAGPLRDRLLAEKTAVFTSATLKLGGDFSAVAGSFGLDRGGSGWDGIDVGSPFDYGKQGILYLAKVLPAPGRDGFSPQALDEIVDLVDAADGRTLGLFSSRRAAEAAGEVVRERLPHLTTLVQGDAQLSELTRQFVGDPHTCLFGTLGLWQGLDVPGDTCQLVLIDRIPFPRPDDPLLSARQRAVEKAGGNGFMTVAASHAALLLAQGAGRLIRTTEDKGVVAILDSRIATARYGNFLRASLPPMWTTQDPKVVREALKRITQ